LRDKNGKKPSYLEGFALEARVGIGQLLTAD
jgi:hypothetical protein